MSSVFVVSEESKRYIKNFLGTNDKNVKRDIEIIKIWIRQQSHLPEIEVFPDEFLERVLLQCKFRIEESKSKIENYCTLRAAFPELYQNYENVVSSNMSISWIHMPNMLPNYERLLIMRMENPNPEQFVYLDSNKCALVTQELFLRYDYNIGIRAILDLGGFTMNHVKRININDFIKAVKLYMGAYSGRVRGIHVVNYPVYFGILLKTFKALIKPDEREKISFHDTIEDIFKLVPQKYWPKEYGGEVGTIAELRKNMDNDIRNNIDYLQMCGKRICKEQKRIVEVRKSEMFGEYGTFKNLNLD
ncbi:alpha-tocopherol transfer protein-like [Aethina tumida]|uniref:alpha-tocopherol transfer protein-like n=1 Tax=Aethina tumida TaxID=116153 RepID=UPI002148F0D5|nr:alpha-tocopherol transfer protein-like [Aethina tumida]